MAIGGWPLNESLGISTRVTGEATIQTICPRCHKRAFSMWRKIHVGPMKRVSCENCGAALTVPWIPGLIVAALIGAAWSMALSSSQRWFRGSGASGQHLSWGYWGAVWQPFLCCGFGRVMCLL